jgi:phage repressor protein C with HTH and peptisase S24 domain
VPETSFELFFQRVKAKTPITSQIELARALNVNRSAVTQAKRRGLVPESWAFKLARMYQLDPDWLGTGRGNPDLHQVFEPREFQRIPKVKARLGAGGGSFEVDGQISEYYAFRWDWLRRKGDPSRMVLMDVVGDSMEPLLEQGDTVLIDQSQSTLISGRIYALGVEDTVLVKRVEKHPGRLVLHSANQHYSPLSLQGDEIDSVRIIGALIWTCRELI